MKHTKLFSLLLVTSLFVISPSAIADNYSKLWKQVESARQKDLPRTQIEILKNIANKALEEKNFGQLMKAEFSSINVWGSISTDSILPQLKRIEHETTKRSKDKALSATYYSVLGMAYRDITIGGIKDLKKS